MWIKYFLALLCLNILFACKTSKRAAKPKGEITTNTAESNAGVTYTLNNLDFHTFSGKSKTQLEFGDTKQDVTLTIRIQRDQAIWISVTALLGIEAARILITPDSVKILNKLQGEYIAKPFSYIYTYTSEGVSFSTLQDLLLANVSTTLLNTDQLTVASATDEVQLIGVTDNLAFQYSLNENDRPKVFRLTTVGTNESLEAVYRQFVSTVGYDFPQSQQLTLAAKTIKVNARLEYSKVEFNQAIELPFSIPARYKVIN